jgi:dsDNA-binding SOS-regulon protein
MALDYKVVKVENSYVVEERLTGYQIKSFTDQNEAKKYMKFLNLGGGFSGFTPSFILNKSSKNM